LRGGKSWRAATGWGFRRGYQGLRGFIMLMSAMGVHQVIVCASFHHVHRVRIVSSGAHRVVAGASGAGNQKNV
jgi:hypothetical protein